MEANEQRCSICGQPGDMGSLGPGPHKFHSVCVNGAWNYIALIQETGGDVSVKRMMVWPAAEEAGVHHPYPPFK